MHGRIDESYHLSGWIFRLNCLNPKHLEVLAVLQGGRPKGSSCFMELSPHYPTLRSLALSHPWLVNSVACYTTEPRSSAVLIRPCSCQIRYPPLIAARSPQFPLLAEGWEGADFAHPVSHLHVVIAGVAQLSYLHAVNNTGRDFDCPSCLERGDQLADRLSHDGCRVVSER